MKRGDHIYVDLGSSKQHGIYCGNGFVIYWTNENSSKSTIRKSSLEEFAVGKTVKKRRYLHKCSSTDSVIKRAERRLKESKPKYQFSDSKAFAMYCKTGLKIGDHLYINCQYYSHHGIYYANDKVAHYNGKRISITSLKKFSKSKTIRVRNYKECSSSRTVVRRVEKRLGEKEYNLIFNNCEHFATWCKTKKHRSKQIDEFPKSQLDF